MPSFGKSQRAKILQSFVASWILYVLVSTKTNIRSVKLTRLVTHDFRQLFKTEH